MVSLLFFLKSKERKIRVLASRHWDASPGPLGAEYNFYNLAGHVHIYIAPVDVSHLSRGTLTTHTPLIKGTSLIKGVDRPKPPVL